MVIYPVILHGDTALPPACLISKLWLWCFKLYTKHYVFIHTLWIIQEHNILPIVKILSVKNARAWVSMVSYLEK